MSSDVITLKIAPLLRSTFPEYRDGEKHPEQESAGARARGKCVVVRARACVPDDDDGVGGGDGPEERPLAAAEHEGLRPEVEQAEDGDAQAAQGPVQPGDHRQPLKKDSRQRVMNHS